MPFKKVRKEFGYDAFDTKIAVVGNGKPGKMTVSETLARSFADPDTTCWPSTTVPTGPCTVSTFGSS